MGPFKLHEVQVAIEAAWSIETCDPVDAADWSIDNPARGQCGATALVVSDLFGGELLIAEVHFQDGRRQGFHYWNRFSSGLEVDLTRGQFSDHEFVQVPNVVIRPPGAPSRCADQYNLLRSRVFEVLSSHGGQGW